MGRVGVGFRFVLRECEICLRRRWMRDASTARAVAEILRALRKSSENHGRF